MVAPAAPGIRYRLTRPKAVQTEPGGPRRRPRHYRGSTPESRRRGSLVLIALAFLGALLAVGCGLAMPHPMGDVLALVFAVGAAGKLLGAVVLWP